MSAKTAIITGASRGLGAALAAAFGYAGYKLILHSKSSDLPNLPDVDYERIKGDLAHDSTISMIYAAAKRNGVDVLINNAGIYLNQPITHTTTDNIESLLAINLRAPMVLTKRLWPILVEQKHGTVVYINSVAGKQGSENEAIYSASKFGLRGFAKSLRYEAIEHNINIITACIGAMKTDMTKDRSNYKQLIDTHEVAQTILDLCKPRQSMLCSEIEIRRKNH